MARPVIVAWHGAPWIWAIVLTVLLLGPALGIGFALVGDMVWVPDLALRDSTLGWGSALPRAVPSDAVVAVLDEVIPGVLLQKIVLVGAFLAAAAGAIKLAGGSVVGRMVAVTVTLWNPFVVERLWIGHWPLLLAAVLWLAVLGGRAAATGRIPLATYPVLLVGSLSANAGLVSAAVLLATGARRRAGTVVPLVLACLAANAPWIVSGLIHADAARLAGGFEAFSTRGDAMPAPITVLSLGGIWNADVVPPSRETWLGWVSTLLLVALAVAGLRRWRRERPVDQQLAMLSLWLVGVVLAVLSGLLPGVLTWLGETVPGLALLRDGPRSLALCLPLLVTLVAAGAEQLTRSWRSVAPRVAAAVVVILAPVALMPDAAWGGGHLGTASYPDEWSDVRTKLAEADSEGTVLVLPWSAYRAPSWNGNRPVLDPLPRFLANETVASDSLTVDGVEIAGEDRRGEDVLQALKAPTPDERAAELTNLGIGWVVTERDSGDAPEVAGDNVHHGTLLDVVRLPDPAADPGLGTVEKAAIGLAWLVYLSVFAGFGLAVARSLRTRQ